MNPDLYFIKLTDHDNQYIHHSDDKGYFVAPGKVGAAMWHLKNANQFINHSSAGNLKVELFVLGTPTVGNAN